VQHARGQAGEAAQRGDIVEIGHDRREAGLPQGSHPLGRGGQRDQAHAAAQRARRPEADVAAADHEHPLAAKAGRPAAERAVESGQNRFPFAEQESKNTHDERSA